MASGALEQSALEAKDREQLVAIAGALGVKSASRAKKAELIEMILEQTKPTEVAPKPAKKVDAPKVEKPAAGAEVPAGPALGADGEPLADWEIELAEHEGTPVAPDARRASEQNPNNNRNNNDRGDRNNNRHNNNRHNNNDRGDRNNNDRGERDNNRNDGGGFGNNRNRNRRRRGKGPRDESGHLHDS